jgi:hypothetical protein
LKTYIQANVPNDCNIYPETHIWEMVKGDDVYLYNKVTGEVRRFADNPSDNHATHFAKQKEIVTRYIVQKELKNQ